MTTTLKSLHRKVASLRQQVLAAAADTVRRWKPWLHRPVFNPSAQNLAHYLALRRQDLQSIQLELAAWGLSSLGRCESKVMPNLDAILATLHSIAGSRNSLRRPGAKDFSRGEERLRRESKRLLGPKRSHRNARIAVTLPRESANDVAWLADLMIKGMDIARINLAHDDPDIWKRFTRSLDAARKCTGRDCRILMDLAGPKLRTGSVTELTRRKRVQKDDRIWLSGEAQPKSQTGNPAFWVQCTLDLAVRSLVPGAKVFIDDGSLACKVISVGPDGALLQVDRCEAGGKKLKPDKGINLPDTQLDIPALTAKDLADLPFAARHAILLGYSFVQNPDDIFQLHKRLRELGCKLGQGPFLVLKIETLKAIRNFPSLCVAAGGTAPAAVMIARGDLAVEIGFMRMAEMQEELLWLCEAAHLPAIWATQVLENLTKHGIPSRAEISDASMSVLAEAVMLNKGPYLPEAVQTLDTILSSMQLHHHHKMPLLRALRSWKDE